MYLKLSFGQFPIYYSFGGGLTSKARKVFAWYIYYYFLLVTTPVFEHL